MAAFHIVIKYRGHTEDVYTPGHTNPSLSTLGHAIESQLNVSYESIKLLGAGRSIVPSFHGTETVLAAGLHPGSRLLLVASSVKDLQAVRAERDLPGLAGFDHELRRAAQRKHSRASSAIEPPKTDFTFNHYESWQLPGLYPPPSDALQLLYRLAGDPGILAVMAEHRWRVGLLKEMPPEGKVGISAMCVLGLNYNAGAEIHLRLRTDDLRGFRKYEKVRETLIHELAHMVYGEHDNSFKTLNSQLKVEVERANARLNEGRRIAAGVWDADNGWPVDSELEALLDAHDVMRATAKLSGRTLRQLAGQGAAKDARGATTDVRALAALAALERGQGCAAAASMDIEAVVKGGEDARGVQDVGHNGPASNSDSSTDGNQASAEPFQHQDARTEQLEEAMRRLGSVEVPPASTAAVLASVGVTYEPHADGPLAGSGPTKASASAAPALAPSSLSGQVVTATAAGTAAPAAMLQLQAVQGASATHVKMHLQQVLADQQGHTAGGTRSQSPTSHDARDAERPAPPLSAAQLCSHTAALPGVIALLAPGQTAPPSPSPELEIAAQGQQQCQQPQPASHLPPATHVADPVKLPSLPSEDCRGDANDMAALKYRQAWQTLSAALLNAPAGAAGAQAALQAVLSVLQNVTQHPGEPKFERVRLAGLQRRLAGAPGVLEVLRIAGFSDGRAQQVAGGGTGSAVPEETFMRLQRRDPGLQWLVMSAVQGALAHVQG